MSNSSNPVHVKIELDENKVANVRFGNLPDIELPKAIAITGNIFAPRDWLSKRKHVVDGQFKDTTYVFVSRRDLQIILKVDEQNPRGYIINGQLKKNPDLAAFQINTQKEYTLAELTKLIRFSRRFFFDATEHNNVLTGLMNFSANTQVQVEAKNDNRGNSKNLNERNSTLNITREFRLVLPVYEGLKPVVFTVEVFFDIKDNGNRFWLESMELADLEESERDNVFVEALKGLDNYALIEL